MCAEQRIVSHPRAGSEIGIVHCSSDHHSSAREIVPQRVALGSALSVSPSRYREQRGSRDGSESESKKICVY
jgi:hypothetical protein